jgi:hypothetical protein
VIDDADVIHMVSQANAVYYVSRDAAGWGSAERVALVASGHPAIAVDESGFVHIGLFDAGAYGAAYATNASGDWVVDQVEDCGNAGYCDEATIAIAVAGTVHLAYLDRGGGTGQLHYGAQEGAGWTVETVDPTNQDARSPSIALDAAGIPSVTYGYRGGGMLEPRLATRSGADWTVETIEPLVAGSWTSLAIGDEDVAHVAYLEDDALSVHLKYGRRCVAR